LQSIAKKLLLLGAALSLAAIAYSFWHRWNGLVGPTDWKEAFLYYALPLGALAALFAFCGLFPRLDRVLAVLNFAAFYLALVGADVYMQYAAYNQDGAIEAAAKRLGFLYDARTKAQVVADLRKRGIRAAPFMRIVSEPDLAMLGVTPNATVVVCNEFGPWFTPTTDRYGFANPDDIWNGDASADAVIVGDSFAMGQCDPTTGGVAGILRGQGMRVLNLGIGGNDPLLDLGSLAEFGSTRKARFVFWLHYAGNDLAGLGVNRRFVPLMRYVNEPSFKQNLSKRMPEIDGRIAAMEGRAEQPRQPFISTLFTTKGLIRAIRFYDLRVAFGFARAINEDIDFPLFKRILMRADEVSTSMGAQLVFVNIPAPYQVGHDSVVDVKTNEIIGETAIRSIDLKPIFRHSGDPAALYSQRHNGHFSPAGNKLVAKLLADAIAGIKN
jgi:hypothetical protein